ncbi:MAG TPA: hypothetical protein VFQ53_36400 [Kofleriaceae bacterium]|nr:hypothetical protein [Kofleriaceae bacterium]
MKAAFWFGAILVTACGSGAAPTPAPSPPAPAPAIVATPDAPEPDAPTLDAAAPPDAAPAPIACKTDDDCWLDGVTPIARPTSERGKKLKPCKDSERIPKCRAHVCTVIAYKC